MINPPDNVTVTSNVHRPSRKTSVSIEVSVPGDEESVAYASRVITQSVEQIERRLARFYKERT